MTAVSEIMVTLQWLNSALANTGGTGVYRDAAPAGAVPPYTVATYYGGSDVMGVHGTRIWSNINWLIEVWGTQDQDLEVDAVATANDQALHDQHSIGVAGGVIVSSVREQARAGLVEAGNQIWRRQGGVYHMEVRAY